MYTRNFISYSLDKPIATGKILIAAAYAATLE